MQLADVAERAGAWLHVDAAYGGAIALSQKLRPLLRGIERADSITFDAHKWLYAPPVSAVILVRDAIAPARSFSAQAAYVEQDREVADRGVDLGFEGLQLSRGFIALRVWVGPAGARPRGVRAPHRARRRADELARARVVEEPPTSSSSAHRRSRSAAFATTRMASTTRTISTASTRGS